MVELYPPIEPYDQGLLDVGDGNHVYWETCGNPDGKPAVMVHGGPGQGITPNMRRTFDPARYRAVLFDQRGSWGTTLALVYAERYPHRVSQIMLSAISTTRRSEIDWLYRGVGRFFPEEWQRFRDGAGGTDRDGDLVAAYARLMESSDPEVRNEAASRWGTWAATPNAPGMLSTLARFAGHQ
jgi:proline iminopeptidase